MRKYALSLEMVVKLAKGLTETGFTKDKYGSVTRKFLSKNSANRLRMYITPSVYQEVILQENNGMMLEFINSACKRIEFDALKNMLAFENEKKLSNTGLFNRCDAEEDQKELIALCEARICNMPFVSKNANILQYKDEINQLLLGENVSKKHAIISIKDAINEMEEYTIYKK